MKNHFLISDKEKNRIRNLHESRKQSHGTGNLITEQIVLNDKGGLTNEQKYELLASGQATAKDIAQIMKSAIGTLNDDEAVMQAAVSAIKDDTMYKVVTQELGEDVVNWLLAEYSDGSGGDKNDYIRDNLGGGKETIYKALERLGVAGGGLENKRKSLSSIIKGDVWVRS